MLIINADDLGINSESIVNTIQCQETGSVTSASIMVFMDNSQRASTWARTAGIEAGLHLNLTEPLNAPTLPERLREYHHAVTRYYGIGKYSSLVFNPVLKRQIDYVFNAQYDEYCRLFDVEPSRIDGHHHMHLSMNIILNNLIPKGIVLRRNFSFGPGEKNLLNRTYRKLIDIYLSRRYRCTDAFYSIKPLENIQRLERIIRLSLFSSVEISVHPADISECRFLLGSQFRKMIEDVPLGAFSKIME
jgi:predicted glycoside hydrolase/deacetylase ChbG (UPF0249 family)